MKIVTYNLNGIRASQKLGVVDWIKEFNADIYCFQETRANEEVCRQFLENNGYDVICNTGTRAGYSGTAILTKVKPNKISFGLDDNAKNNKEPIITQMSLLPEQSTSEISGSDDEGRTITAWYDNFIVVNCYVPNGANRLDFKLDYYKKLTKHLQSLAKENNVILCSDINTAHAELDLSHPKECSTRSGYLPVERDAITNLLSKGFVDAFRYKNPTSRTYSWRSYGSRIYGGDYGWKYRFDYIIVNKKLINKVQSVEISDLEYSDHLPLIMKVDLGE